MDNDWKNDRDGIAFTPGAQNADFSVSDLWRLKNEQLKQPTFYWKEGQGLGRNVRYHQKDFQTSTNVPVCPVARSRVFQSGFAFMENNTSSTQPNAGPTTATQSGDFTYTTPEKPKF